MARYPRLGLPLPLELLNTTFASAGQPRDALATPEDLDAWLDANAEHFARVPPPATPGHVLHFRTLRDALERLCTASIAGSPPPVAALELLNALSARAPRVAQLEYRDGRYQAHTLDLADAEAAALASVARASIALLTGPDRARLRRCGAPGCVLFFLKDRSRRAWCSDACGNRARVARHYERHRRAPAGA